LLLVGLAVLRAPGGAGPVVPAGARAGDLALRPCTYDTEAGRLPADCGTLVVPENRGAPDSRLIALPVVRVRATGADPAEPVFRLNGGPGLSNTVFREASRLTGRHDVVLVGYRGVDSSTVLSCPEVEAALRGSADLAGEESMRRYAGAFGACARRLTASGVDLAGYSLPQRVDDLEDARRALGYGRIDLLSESAGTRTAMIYSWRRPESLRRSVMVGVNPPGHFLWDPAITDEQLRHYADLCRADTGCAARTDDLAASMRATAADLPGGWGPLPIKDGNVRAATMLGLFNTATSAPLNAPTMIDAWLSAADGDPSGLWVLSVLADLVFPRSFEWGEFASAGIIDADAVDAYYAAGGDPGSILGGATADLLWAGGRLTGGWPAEADAAEYATPRSTPVETLLVGGTLDFSTPVRPATDDLLPTLPDGHQVVLAELGHTGDFWDHRPAAATRLLGAFFDSGTVDASGFPVDPVPFDVGPRTLTTVARTVVAVVIGLVVLAAGLLGWLLHRRGRFGPRVGVVLRGLAPVVLGIGGWCLAMALGVLVVGWPPVYPGSPLLTVPLVGLAAGLGVQLVRRRPGGLLVVLAGAVGAALGALGADPLGGGPVALVWAVLVANLVALAIDIARAERVAAGRELRPGCRAPAARAPG
jgi:pimeloyl-ACP methyl ester carboxylesterase